MKLKTSILIACLLGIFSAVQAANAGNKIEITGNDTMQFNSKVFEVAAGQEVTLVFKNLGKLPKAAMGHNVVVLKPGSDVMKFGGAAVAAAASEYIPQDGAFKDQIVAHTKLLGPGEEDTITFTLPEAGVYPFLCSFPGHFALMNGTITAK